MELVWKASFASDHLLEGDERVDGVDVVVVDPFVHVDAVRDVHLHVVKLRECTAAPECTHLVIV